MKTLFKIFFRLLFLSPLIVSLIIIFLAFENTPLVNPGTPLNYRDLEQVHTLIQRNDPRQKPEGTVQTLRLDESEVNLLLAYAGTEFIQLADHAGQTRPAFHARAKLGNGVARVQLTLPLSVTLLGRFINVELQLEQADFGLTVSRMKIGKLPVPHGLATIFSARIDQQLFAGTEIEKLAQAVRDYRITPGLLEIRYVWNDDVATGLAEEGQHLISGRSAGLPLAVYHKKMHRFANSFLEGQKLSVSEFLSAVFNLARQRSQEGFDPIAENKAAILVAALYLANDNPKIHHYLKTSVQSFQGTRTIVPTLHGRKDLANHFVISAAITISSNGNLADQLGLFKEMQDADSLSGFDISDVAANLAGIHFGETAIASLDDALLLQERVAAMPPETALMPTPEQLRQFSSLARIDNRTHAEDFVASDAFQQWKTSVLSLIHALPLYR